MTGRRGLDTGPVMWAPMSVPERRGRGARHLLSRRTRGFDWLRGERISRDIGEDAPNKRKRRLRKYGIRSTEKRQGCENDRLRSSMKLEAKKKIRYYLACDIYVCRCG